jgi:probable phosphoglycerate mutase
MLNIYLARHGQNEDNLEGILNGHRDRALTETGVNQAEKLAKHIKASGLIFSQVYSSPLVRAYKTAEIITDYLNLNKPTFFDLLIERNFGIMTGRPAKDIEKYCAPDIIKTETATYFLKAEDAETFPELIMRAKNILAEIMRRHQEGNILLVTHGDIGKMIYAAYYNLDWRDVLRLFHFGNSDLLILAADSKPEEVHVFKNKQFNS